MKKETVLNLIAILFVVSGASGLIYQIAWFKYLSLFLGNTTYAQTVVLATFMAGLAIGASLWGRRSDKMKHPLRLYALLEILIGIYCLLYPSLIELLKSVFVSLVQSAHLPSDSVAVLILKLVVSVTTLLFPTILMGGTLPVLVRTISFDVADSGKNVATLYFLNSFGAVVGSMLGGFLMIPLIGLKVTVYGAGFVNLLVGSIAWLLSRLWLGDVAEEKAPDVSSPQFSEREIKLALLTAGLSGLASMIYEVTWLRLLIPVIGSSTYSYTLLLVTFITGITIGSLNASRLFLQPRNPYRLLALCQLGAGLAMAFSLPLYGRVPYVYWYLGGILNRTEFTYPIFLSLQFILVFVIMLIPTIFLGMSLPLASHIASRRLDVLGRSIGNVFSINTVGTVVGSLAAGFVLIPLIGVRMSMEVGLCVNIGVGMILILYGAGIPKFRKAASIVGVGSLATTLFFLTSDWDQTIALSGVFRTAVRNIAPPSSYSEFERMSSERNVLFFKEGATATVAVVQSRNQFGVNNSLYINGKADASSATDLPTQILLGEIPMILHPKPDTVLVIGLGSGVTMGSVLRHPVGSVEVVEISPEVIEASKYFADVSGLPLDDRRSKIYVDDALSFLKVSPSGYDVIISEPTNPWIAGVGNLYTVEFLQECRKKLKTNGLMVQWFHLYEMSDETFGLVLRTFASAFPHVTLWQPFLKDVILVGSMEPIQLDETGVQSRFANPAIRADLRRIQILDPTTFLSLQFLSQEKLIEHLGVGEVNAEDRPLLEYVAPRDFFVNRGAFRIMNSDERQVTGRGGTMLHRVLAQRALADSELANLGRFHSMPNRGNQVLGYSLLAQYLAKHPRDIAAQRSMIEVTRSLGRREESLHLLKNLKDELPLNPEVAGTYAWEKFVFEHGMASTVTHFNIDESRRLLEQCVSMTKDTVAYYHAQLGEMFFVQQQYGSALDEYRKFMGVLDKFRQDPMVALDGVLLNAAKCCRFLGQKGQAMDYALQATQINPRNEEAKDFFYRGWVNAQRK